MATNLLREAFHAPRRAFDSFVAAYRANLRDAAKCREAGICTHCRKEAAATGSEYCDECRLWVNSAP